MDAREQQREFWNSKGGERWVTHEAMFDSFVRPFGDAALRNLKLQTGEHVLDVGCGTGDTLAAISSAVGPTGSVTGVDISVPMLERAKQRVPSAHLIAGDASTQAFSRQFDALFSRFGVMFFAEPLSAFKHLRAALKPQARVSFVCWREAAENPWAVVPALAVRAALPDAQGWEEAGGPGPFSLGNRVELTQLMNDAGFHSVQITPFEREVEISNEGLDHAAHFAVTTGPAARLLVNASDDQKELAKQAVAEALRPYLVGERVALPGAVWLVQARA